jgi:CRISPR/Cas system-associated protein Csm6
MLKQLLLKKKKNENKMVVAVVYQTDTANGAMCRLDGSYSSTKK